MRLKNLSTLSMFTALLFTAQAATAQVDLRGPAATKGQTTVTTVETSTDKGKLTINAGGQVIQGQMQFESNQVTKTKILEVVDSSPVKVELEYEKSVTKMSMTVNGQPMPAKDDKSMEGLVLTQTKQNGKWKTEVKKGTLPPQAKQVLKNMGYVDPRVAYPEKPVKVGDSWKLTGDDVMAMMGGAGFPGAKVKGSITFTLDQVKKVGADSVAMISYKMDITLAMKMNQPGMVMDMTIKMGGKGTMDRNLTSYVNSSNKLKGDMDMTMVMNANGRAMMNMTATMPLKMTSKEEKK